MDGFTANLVVVLDAPVPEPLVEHVRDKLAHVEYVQRCQLDGERDRLTLLVDDARRGEAEHAVRAVVAAMVRDYRPVEKTILWHQARTPRHRAPIWDALIATGLVHAEGAGCVSLLGAASRIATAVDGAFAAIARDVFDAEPHQYPSLIASSTLERCDYFSSFPHHLTFAPHIIEDVAAINRIGDTAARGRQAAIAAGLAPPTHALSPSICFHTYAALADREITGNRTSTAVGRCYRWESTNFATCERLWDFTMREIVFVGDPDWVEDRRELALDQVRQFVDELELDAWVESATDPFFIGRFATKRYYQLLRRAKYELRLSLPYSGGSLSAASFNVHDDFFARAFAIRGPDSNPVATGCFGAGIERWVWALFAQHGPDLAQWPAQTRARLAL